ncbi:MAG: potassium transporter TrkG [Rivularia sp. (in: cyanobacteria)]
MINYSFFGSPFWLHTVFQWASVGTCGFNTIDLYDWSDRAKLLLTLAMIIGGTAGSTVGGFKLNRLVFLCKGAVWKLRRISLKSHESMNYKLDGEVVNETEASRRIEAATILGFLWIVILIIRVFVLLQLNLLKLGKR